MVLKKTDSTTIRLFYWNLPLKSRLKLQTRSAADGSQRRNPFSCCKALDTQGSWPRIFSSKSKPTIRQRRRARGSAQEAPDRRFGFPWYKQGGNKKGFDNEESSARPSHRQFLVSLLCFHVGEWKRCWREIYEKLLWRIFLAEIITKRKKWLCRKTYSTFRQRGWFIPALNVPLTS